MFVTAGTAACNPCVFITDSRSCLSLVTLYMRFMNLALVAVDFCNTI